MHTVARPADITPDPEAAGKLQAELLARKASVEIIFRAGFEFAVEQMTPPPPRPHLRLVT